MNNDFNQRIIKLHGKDGEKWLSSIPELLEKYQQQWKIKVFSPFALSYNYVCPAEAETGEKLVLKLSFPGNDEFTTEFKALQLLPSEVVVNLIREDVENGVLLLERATPGSPISKIKNDKKQIRLVAQVISKLHQPISSGSSLDFPSVSDWSKAFVRYRNKYSVKSGPIPYKILDRGEGIFRDLLQEQSKQVLLHGDLHNDNILSSPRGWLVIDPKGVIGEREFELAAYLRNPYLDLPKGSNYGQLQTNRILQFSEELSFDKHRVHNWALAGAIISLLWFLEDEGIFKDIYVQNAELISKLKI